MNDIPSNFLQPMLTSGNIVVNTKAIYLSVLETGLSLIAVNLPSLCFVFTRLSPEKVLRSVRSMISLRSDRSSGASHQGRGGGGGGAQSYPSSSLDKKRSNNSSSSQSHLTHPDAQGVQTYAMDDLEYGKERTYEWIRRECQGFVGVQGMMCKSACAQMEFSTWRPELSFELSIQWIMITLPWPIWFLDPPRRTLQSSQILEQYHW